MVATIRPMMKKDKPAIMRILRNIPEFKPIEVEVAEEVLREYLQKPNHGGYHVFVAEAGASITGYICYGHDTMTEGTWDIYWLAVAPDKQRRGTGKALLAFAEDKIKADKGRLAIIETSSKPEYEKTRQFHRSQGYELACQIADFYAPGDDKLVFQKRLT